MASTQDFVEYICERLEGVGVIRTLKMFGEYCIYIDEKAAILVCDDIPYIKKHPAISHLMGNAECGFPFEGAKEHYILNLEHADEAREIMATLVPALDYPKKKVRKKKQKGNEKN